MRTESEIKRINERLGYVARAYHRVVLDPYYLEATALEPWVRLRQLSIVRAAVVHKNVYLLTHWTIIKAEIDIPWSVHYDRAGSGWSEIDRNSFYSSTSDPNTSMRKWIPVKVSGIVDIKRVSKKTALQAIRFVGGHLPSETHPGIGDL